MSTGKRLAKRSIIGMRVCALSPDDGLYYPGRITSVKTPDSPKDNQNCINLTPNTRYSVRFDPNPAFGPHRRGIYEFSCSELIGDGFGNITDVKLKPGQKIYITHNGRETGGVIVEHDVTLDEVTIEIQTNLNEVSLFAATHARIYLKLFSFIRLGFVHFLCKFYFYTQFLLVAALLVYTHSLFDYNVNFCCCRQIFKCAKSVTNYCRSAL